MSSRVTQLSNRRLDSDDRLAVEPREVWRARAARWLRLSLFSSLAASAACLPLVASTFGVLTPWSPLVNLLAIPVAGLALAAGLVLLLVGSLIPPLAFVPAAVTWGLLKLLQGIVGAATLLPGSTLASDRPPAWALLAFYGLALVLLWPRLLPARWRARAALAVLVLAVPASLAGRLPAPPSRGLRVTLLSLFGGLFFLSERKSALSVQAHIRISLERKEKRSNLSHLAVSR